MASLEALKRRAYTQERMDHLPPDVREQVLLRIFPDLRYGGDPDIELYFDLRAHGRMLDALAIYSRRLKPRYPDDAKRILLLKLYRTKSPDYHETLKELLLERADEMIERIRRGVDSLVGPLEGVPIKDTYAVLKAVERIARLLPDDTDSARRMAWAYADYAKLLDFRRREMERAAYLVGEFFDQARIEQETPADFVASSLASEEAREAEEASRKNFFDLSKIEFDRGDVERIEIPGGLERDEDKVLAFCHKYWLRVDDGAFERILWLYSKKYGTNHFQVFRAIKSGRARKYQDDDVLAIVMTTIATKYNYTVRGELYMQAAWRRIKATLYGGAQARQVGADAGVSQSEMKPSHAASRRSAAAASRRVSPETRVSEAPAPKAGRDAGRVAESMVPRRVPARGSGASAGARSATRRRDSEKPLLRATVSRSAGNGFARGRAVETRASKPRLESLPAAKGNGSVSDTIRRLSGRAYDVYRNIFFERVRNHIHAELLRCRMKTGASHGDDTNAAENIVYEFLEANYTNAYMDWRGSGECEKVRGLGFELSSLDEIIKSCYGKIGT